MFSAEVNISISEIVSPQVIISILVAGLEKPTAILTQPVRSEAFVELSCDFTLTGLASFLAYNLTLVLLCSIFAFKTRKLPDNFNESRFMSMCVATTLVIWLAFIPTFLTSSRQYLKTLLLTLALLLNHSVALVFLFLSKLYAVIYLQNEAQDHTASARANGILRVQPRSEYVSSTSINIHGNAACPQSQIWDLYEVYMFVYCCRAELMRDSWAVRSVHFWRLVICHNKTGVEVKKLSRCNRF